MIAWGWGAAESLATCWERLVTWADRPLTWAVIDAWEEANRVAKLVSCCLRSRISAWRAWVSKLKAGPATPLSKAKVAELRGAAIAGAVSSLAVAAAVAAASDPR